MSSAGGWQLSTPTASGSAAGILDGNCPPLPPLRRERTMHKTRLAPYYDGWFSQRDGLSHISNPYDLLRQSFSAAQWDKGWTDRRRAVTAGVGLDLDFELPAREW